MVKRVLDSIERVCAAALQGAHNVYMKIPERIRRTRMKFGVHYTRMKRRKLHETLGDFLLYVVHCFRGSQ